MTDKSKELFTTLSLINNKLHFRGKVDGNEPVSIDYIPPYGDNLGYTSLELLLLSISSCLGSSLLIFLRRMKKDISGFSIDANGIRKDEHPSGFKTITLMINLKSSDTKTEDLDKIVMLAEETYCPVWSMLKGNVDIIVKYNITSH